MIISRNPWQLATTAELPLFSQAAELGAVETGGAVPCAFSWKMWYAALHLQEVICLLKYMLFHLFLELDKSSVSLS